MNRSTLKLWPCVYTVRAAAICGLAYLVLCATPVSVSAANLGAAMNELGAIAGAGMACGAKKLDEYERITAAIIQARANTVSQREAALKEYARAKKRTLKKQKSFPPMGCAEVRRRFDAQDIFDTRIYADGSVRTPDGAIYKPVLDVIPYDIAEETPPAQTGQPTNTTATQETAAASQTSPQTEPVPTPPSTQTTAAKPQRTGPVNIANKERIAPRKRARIRPVNKPFSPADRPNYRSRVNKALGLTQNTLARTGAYGY